MIAASPRRADRMAMHTSIGPPSEQPGALTLYPPTRTGRFDVPLDHFRYTPQSRFHLRFAAYETFAVHHAAPVLFYCGNEGPLELFYNNSGALFEHAALLGARVLFVEHRYYGASLPFGNTSFTNDALQWLTVEQALADYASCISSLPALLGCIGTGIRRSAGRCDVVLFGGSYGGMLAAWHRLRYPFLSVGAIASGAPIDFYATNWARHAEEKPVDVQTLFLDAVVNTFEVYGGGRGGCGTALRRALNAVDNATIEELIVAGVRPCHAWRADSAERYAFYAKGAIADIALVDYPYPTNFIAPLPANPVQAACRVLETRSDISDAASSAHKLRASTLQSLHRAVLTLVNASGDLSCLDLRAELVGDPSAGQPTIGRAPASSFQRATVASSDLGVTAWNYQGKRTAH